MNSKFLFITTIIFCTEALSQNLVPNPGFEDTTGCPGADVYLNHTNSWERIKNHYGTPDLFYGDCLYNGIGEANQMAPGQFPYEGIGCIGLFAHGDNLREYCTVRLIQPLIKGKEYQVEFWVRPANGYGTAINTFGLHFSNSEISGESESSLAFIPMAEHIGNPSNRLIDDPSRWIKIEGKYLAKGGEQFITIGNFKNDAQTKSEVFNESCIRSDRSYMLIDNVSIQEYGIDSENIITPDSNLTFTKFARDLIVVDSFQVQSKTITIEIWDRYTEDGDTINVFLNGENILSEFRITKKHYLMTTTIQNGENIIEIQALNLGTLTPNTVSVRISDGQNSELITFSSDLTITEAVKIIFKE